MRTLVHTVTVATVSSLTTALLFAACTSDAATRSPGATAARQEQVAAQAPSPTAELATATAGTLAQPLAPAQPADRLHPAARVYQQNGPSVVNVNSVAVVRTLRGTAERPRGTGSGFVVDADGHIVTNNHVVEDAQQLTVTFKDNTTMPATLVGRDPDNDLAVIKVDPNATDEHGAPIRDRLQPVVLGDSDQITIGEDAIAIGSPLGLQQTVTSGIVSAVRGPGEETARGQVDLLGGAVQTDTSINPGNSGGPLFNARGEVIGVNTAILSTGQIGGNIGIGFAIPVNVVKRVVPELIQTGRYPHPFIGVTTVSLARFSSSVRQQLDLPAKGLLVQEASAGAAEAGIRAGDRLVAINGEPFRLGGDVIVAIDGRPIVGDGDLRGYIENHKRPGDTVTLTISRDGAEQQVTVHLTERPTLPGR